MWNSQVIVMLLEGIRDTLYMTLASTLFGYIIGLPMGIVLTVTDKDGIRPNAAVYKVLDVISKPAAQYSVYYFTDCADSVYQICGGKKLRIDGDDRPADDCGGTLHCQNGRILIKRGGCRRHRGSALHGSIRFSDCDQGYAGGGENVSDCRSNDFPWHNFGIFRDGRNRRRRRTRRYCHPLWLHQMADRYHGCHSGASGNFIPDFPDDRYEDCESAGSQKVAITNLHIF